MLRITQDIHKSLASDSQGIRILLVDDQKLVRHELEQILSSKAELKIVGTASDGKEAIALVESLKPDVLLIDLEMPGINGIDAASIVERQFPECKILVLSSHEDPEYVQKAISAGVDGYILKSTQTKNLITAIYSVYNGYAYFETQLLKKLRFNDTNNSTKVERSNQREIEPTITSEILSVTKKKYRSRTKWIIWLGLGIAIAIGGVMWSYHKYFRQSTEAVTVEILPVQKGTVENTVSESGKLELGEQQTIKSPKDNATVEQVNVIQGGKIEDGEPLIVLRDRDTQEQEQDQKLEITKSLLIQKKNQKAVLEAQEKVKKEQALVRESVELFQKGYIAESELEEDREQLETAKSELTNTELEFDSAKLDLQHGQAKLASIQQKLSDRFVTSPIDGVVLDVGVKNGNGITTDTKLLTIGDPKREIVKLQLTTLNASKVKLNQAARVSVIGPNPKVYPGKVISLSPQATIESSDSASESSEASDGSAKVKATVLLDKPSRTIIPGSQVNVEIISQQRQNVVVLPLEMLQNNGNKPFVWVKNKRNQAKKRLVTLGLEDLSSVEITSGLQAGDRVVLPLPDSTINPGTPIQADSENSL